MLAIIGPGAVGTVLAAYLGRAGLPLRLIGTEADIAAARQAEALTLERVTGGPPLQLPRPRLATAVEAAETHAILICVKQTDLDSVIAGLPTDLAADIPVGVVGNGAGALRRLRDALPAQRIVPITVLFNAQRLEALHVRLSARPRLGVPHHEPAMERLFARSAIALQRSHGEAGAWGHLLFNLCAGLAATTGYSFRRVLVDATLRPLYAQLLGEGMQTLRRAGIAFALPVALPGPLFLRALRLPSPAAWWAARGPLGLSEHAYPSMVSDLAHGRRTEVDAINGEIVRIARTMGRDAPCNRALCRLVHELESAPERGVLDSPTLLARLAR